MKSETIAIVIINLPDDVAQTTALEFHRSVRADIHAPSTKLHLSTHTLALLSPEPDGFISGCLRLFRKFPRARAIATMSSTAFAIEHEGHDRIFVSDELEQTVALLGHVKAGSFITTKALRECLGAFELQLEETSVPEVFLGLGGKDVSLLPSYTDPDVKDAEQMEVWAKKISGAIEHGLTGKSPESLDMLIQNADRILNTIQDGASVDPTAVAKVLCSLRLWLNPLWTRPIALEVTRELLESDRLGAISRIEVRELYASQLKKLGRADDSIKEHAAILSEPEAPAPVLARCHIALSELHVSKQEVELAKAYAERGLIFCEEHGLLGYKALAHQAIAEALIAEATSINTESTARILKQFEQSVAVAQASEDLQVQLIALGEWSNFSSMETPAKSLENLKRVKELATMLRIEHFVSMCLSVMGDIALRIKRPDLAREYLEQVSARLDENDRMGHWHKLFQETIICLYEQNYEQATRCTTLLEELNAKYDFKMGAMSTTRLHMLIALMMEQFERFDLIVEGEFFEEENIGETICMLRDLLTDRQDEGKLQALVERLAWHQTQALHHELMELVWRKAITHFPEAFVPARAQDTIAVHAEQGWFISREQSERVELAHRPYLHRMFNELLAQHETRGKGIDTLDLFDACWPDETASFEVMKNRVYVGISNLRKLGLRPWLVRLPDGYTLSESLDVIHAHPTALE